ISQFQKYLLTFSFYFRLLIFTISNPVWAAKIVASRLVSDISNELITFSCVSGLQYIFKSLFERVIAV
ncbi:MAG: hypothetical protein PUE95_10495, partial [Lachnospiraceae bacterium]|nr:hypothetical protein [Lachnospiraceae bacterium]